MGIIKLLDKDTVNKIAAGEVIENPAAVVKELVENSIDAEADSVTVEIKEGGKELIRVTDNGFGMEALDLRTAFLPHATSKIKKIEDLFSIRSLGFRGEALPSIASVSKTEAFSKTVESLSGTMILIEGGEEKESKEIGVPEGTTFVVRELFYNTPARKKFLKSASTEGRYVLEVMEKIALSHPHIAFKFIMNGQVKFQTTGNGNLKDTIFYMYGKDVSSNIFPLPPFQSKEGYEVSGFIGKPSLIRGNREYETYFINGRAIKDKVITRAIEAAYKPFIMGGKFPFTCLLLKVKQELVDVNVHPKKLEVRFAQADEIYSLVYHAVTESLKGRELIPDASYSAKSENTTLVRDFRKDDFVVPNVPMPEPFESKREEEWKKELKPLFKQESFLAERHEYEPKVEEKKPPLPERENSNTVEEELLTDVEITFKEGEARKVEPPFQEKEALEPLPTSEETSFKEAPGLMEEKIFPDIKFVGQVFGTYWIVQYGDKVYMIDQHAAHEKVMYERFLERFKTEKVSSQTLLPPKLIRLSESQLTVFFELKEELFKLGFEAEPFGGVELILKAVPTELFGLSAEEALMDILDSSLPGAKERLSENTLDRLASKACKAAVKGNHSLSEEEARRLIKDLMSLDNPYNCPHGRPTMIFLSKAEIEKKFKRQL